MNNDESFSGIRLFSMYVSCYPFPYILKTSSSEFEWPETCETVSRETRPGSLFGEPILTLHSRQPRSPFRSFLSEQGFVVSQDVLCLLFQILLSNMGLHILDFILVDSFIVEGSPLGQSLIDTIQHLHSQSISCIHSQPLSTIQPDVIKMHLVLLF
jgi:hypothetical protein